MTLELRDRITTEGVLSALGKDQKAFFVEVKEEIMSTNTQLKAAGRNGAADGTVLIARRQTAGRGRMDRRFESPEGGIYMSLLLRPGIPVEDILYMTTLTAVAVAEAVEEVCGIHPGIKWVNDLYVGNRKVCGILTEAVFDTDGGLDCVVIGIGLNVYAPKEGFPEEIREIAGALYGADEREEERRNRLIASVLNKIRQKSFPLDKRKLSIDYKNRSMVIGRWVTVCRGTTEREALVLDINEENHLVVRYGDGAEEALSTGEIRVKLQR